MEHKRDFKGIWIPKDIWLNPDLSAMDKLMLAEIHSLDNENGCFASNAYFANFFGLSERQVSRIINGLFERGCITVTVNDDNRRILSIGSIAKTKMSIGVDKNVQPPRQKCLPPLDKNVYHITKIDNKDIEHTEARAWSDFRDGFEDWWTKLYNLTSLPPSMEIAEHLRWLFDNGFSLEDCKAWHKYATTDPSQAWRKGNIKIQTIVKDIAQWKAAKMPLSTESVFEQQREAEKRAASCHYCNGEGVIRRNGGDRRDVVPCNHTDEMKKFV